MDRGKPGSKMHILSDANGLPLLVGVSVGNTHDREGLKPMIEGHQTRHDPRNGRHSKPQRLHADKAYDRADLHRCLRGKRIGVRIERTMSWLSGYRRLSPRYERNPRSYPGLSRPRRRHLLLQTARPPHHVGHGLGGAVHWAQGLLSFNS